MAITEGTTDFATDNVGRHAQSVLHPDGNFYHQRMGAALTDRSGTIAAGGTAQQIAAASNTRRYLLIQNQSVGPLYVNFGTTAVAGQPSIALAACAVANDGTGGVLEYLPGSVPPSSVSIIGATTGQAFTAKEVP